MFGFLRRRGSKTNQVYIENAHLERECSRFFNMLLYPSTNLDFILTSTVSFPDAVKLQMLLNLQEKLAELQQYTREHNMLVAAIIEQINNAKYEISQSEHRFYPHEITRISRIQLHQLFMKNENIISKMRELDDIRKSLSKHYEKMEEVEENNQIRLILKENIESSNSYHTHVVENLLTAQNKSINLLLHLHT